MVILRLQSDHLNLDLDYFKKINDTYGHATGDEVLKDFVNVCFKNVRDIDVVARVGGEEFVIMLPETDVDQACVFARRVLESVASSEVVVGNARIRYTVSIGITSLQDDTSLDSVSKRVDKALYEAKNSGRNNIKVI